jgi:MFS family permease
MFSGWTRNVTRHGYVVVLSIVVWGVAIVGFGVVDGLLASMVCLAVAGGAAMVSGVSRNAMLQLTASPELRGRMEGVGMAVWTSGPALGDFEAGTVAALTSLDTSVWLGGVTCVIGIVVIAAAVPEFTFFDAARARAPATPSAVSDASVAELA